MNGAVGIGGTSSTTSRVAPISKPVRQCVLGFPMRQGETSVMAKRAPLKQAATALRKHSLGYPDTIEDFPWGHSAFKVKGKVFLFTYLCEEEGFLSLSMKLPVSGTL